MDREPVRAFYNNVYLVYLPVCSLHLSHTIINYHSIFRCLNQCTYCKTKHARGDLGSYPPEEIVARARQAFEGKRCIKWLKE